MLLQRVHTRLLAVLVVFSTLALLGRGTDLLAQTATDAERPLVQRDRVQLALAGAQHALAACRVKAQEIGVKVNIAAVDDGGHLIAFVRMDGARPGSVYTSITKATSAATKRGATGPLGVADAAGTHLSLAVENAAAASGGKFTTLKGGIPIVVSGQVIGALGVGGATGEEDAIVAQAGIDALLARLDQSETSSAEGGETTTAAPNTENALVGQWLVEDIDGHGIVKDSRLTLQFNQDGDLAGNTGVNRFHGKASLDGQEIEMGNLAMTRRAGPPALMQQETQFVEALSNVVSYRVESGQAIHLLDSKGQTIIRATKVSEKAIKSR